MFDWHGKLYLGAAHGVTGICHILLRCGLAPEATVSVLDTLRFVARTRFPSGNFDSSLGAGGTRGHDDDVLVQWCHGAPGAGLAYVAAYEATRDGAFLAVAEAAAEVVWARGLLRKGCGLCHGVGGNGYLFLALYRATRAPVHLHRARAFARVVAESFDAGGGGGAPAAAAAAVAGVKGWHDVHEPPLMVRGGDASFSEGRAGACLYLLHAAMPEKAGFPTLE